MLLVDGVSVLVTENITQDAIANSSLAFVQFVVEMEDYYGLNNVSFNEN